jgi:hypothetical protein
MNTVIPEKYVTWLRDNSHDECYVEYITGHRNGTSYNPRKRGVCPLCNKWRLAK